MYKQIIIARKDLNMSIGKICSQVSHASMAFLTQMIRNHTVNLVDNFYRVGTKENPQYYLRQDLNDWAKEARESGKKGFFAEPVNPEEPYGALQLCESRYHYSTKLTIENDLYEQWFNGSFTKVVLQARNRNQLLKAKTMAEELGMKEGEDFFLIKDECRTELEPEEVGENGIGRTLTCIGFAPMDSEIIDKIGKKYHLYV